MSVQKERDPKNSLRFYITVSEGDVGPLTINSATLSIMEAEKLVASMKTLLAKRGAEHILERSKKLKSLLPSGSYGDAKPYIVKRTGAGNMPAHFRVGIQITFNDPGHAQTFAKAIGLT